MDGLAQALVFLDTVNCTQEASYIKKQITVLDTLTFIILQVL